MIPAPDRLIEAAEAAVDAAGAVIRSFFRTDLSTALKSDASPVTQADQQAEQAMRAVLRQRFPNHGLFGEEFGRENDRARLRWVLDPIDGTRAFITGRPIFGTLVSFLDGDEPILGVIDQPVTGERWIGLRGAETQFRGLFGGEVGTRPCPTLAQAELSCTTPEMMVGVNQEGWDSLAASVARCSWGGDCYAYGLLALGQIDIIAEASMKLWDWAALQPIIEGAGGRLTDWRGEKLRPHGDGRVLAVGDPSLLYDVVARLN